jgi:protoheme IX farnesyltransferase
MKATLAIPERAVEGSRLGIAAELAKARLTTLVLITTWAGFYLGATGPVHYAQLLWTLLGTGLLASGAAALNQLVERDQDARMHRTAARPLPGGKIHPDTVLMAGALASIAGLAVLSLQVNALTSFLGAFTLVSYLFVYTPLKRVTTLNTVIGAVPGALPPLMGWTAARGLLSVEGWALFAILFFWQLPHFFAIGWMYREDYARGGFVMLPTTDATGERTGRQAVSHTLGLLWASILPVWLGLSGKWYLASALLLGAVFLAAAIQFSANLSVAHARRLFFVSILYLPLLLGVMVLDKLR